MVNDELENM